MVAVRLLMLAVLVACEILVAGTGRFYGTFVAFTHNLNAGFSRFSIFEILLAFTFRKELIFDVKFSAVFDKSTDKR